MALIVQKFGGSSVADAAKIENVCRVIAKTYDAGNDVVVVLSAQGDTTDDLIEKAMENAKSVGTVNELGNPVVHVKDTGTDVVISKTGIRHSMDRRADVVGSVAVKIGDILSNAVLMNELNPRSENITDSYILIGAAKNKTNEPYIVSFVVNRYTSEVTDIDVLYAVNAKKEPVLLPQQY